MGIDVNKFCSEMLIFSYPASIVDDQKKID